MVAKKKLQKFNSKEIEGFTLDEHGYVFTVGGSTVCRVFMCCGDSGVIMAQDGYPSGSASMAELLWAVAALKEVRSKKLSVPRCSDLGENHWER